MTNEPDKETGTIGSSFDDFMKDQGIYEVIEHAKRQAEKEQTRRQIQLEQMRYNLKNQNDEFKAICDQLIKQLIKESGDA